MKKILILFLAIIAALIVAAVIFAAIVVVFFTPKDPVLETLPKYQSKEYYSSDGFQDFTDYAKYTYQISESEISGSELLHPVTESDIPTILEYVGNFKIWTETNSDFPSESYDFDKSSISEGDYFYIYYRYKEPERDFWNYDLYYFDVDTSVLHYFHNNI